MKGKKHWRLAVLLLTIAVLVSGCNLFAKPNRYIEGEVTMGDGKAHWVLPRSMLTMN